MYKKLSRAALHEDAVQFFDVLRTALVLREDRLMRCTEHILGDLCLGSCGSTVEQHDPEACSISA